MSDKPILKVVGSTASRAANDFYLPTSEVDRLANAFATNRHLAKLPPAHVRNLIATAAHRRGGVPELKDIHDVRRAAPPEILKPKPLDPERMQALQAQIKVNEEAERSRISSTKKSWQRGLMDEADALFHRADEQRRAVEKASAGMGFVMAALFAIGALSNFQHARKKDENGEYRIQPTQVGIGILMSALAIGTALVSHSSWKAAGHAH